MGFKLTKALLPIFFLLFQFNIISLQQNPIFSSVSQTPEAYSVVNSKDVSFAANSSNNHFADYTLLIYMIGSDLESKSYSATNDLIEMKNAAHNSKINVILETGGGGGTINTHSGGKRFIDFSKVQRHEVLNGTISTLMDLGERNMGDPGTLSDFIRWGVLEFPAKKYAIILWDHGSGLNGFGKDLMFNNDVLTPIELKQAFLNAKVGTNITFELIGFDACLMSSLEVASKLQNVAHYMVSSEEVEPSWGWNYTAIIQNLTANSEQSGRYLGMAIADSFVTHSKNFSISEKFGADKAITLALIDMAKIPDLVKDVNALYHTLGSNIADLASAISLSRATDLTEHYGQSARGRSGFVDLYDLLLNIQEKYPSLSENIKAVQNLLSTTIISKVHGDARPNANGLSVYMPLLKNEFNNKTELFVISPDWLRLLSLQNSMTTTDISPPIIKSIREGNIVKARVYGSDIESIYAQIVTNSSKGHNLMYLQNIDPSLIDNQGYFQFKQHKVLVVCNETKCIPASMKLEVNRDKEFAFIPVRLDSKQNNIHEDVSLIYEIGKDGKFVFLGANPEIDPQKTVPKGEFSLSRDDKIFFKAEKAAPQYKGLNDISGRELYDSTFFEDGPLLVNNPQKVEPHYANFTSPFALSFTMCDYADNCDKTRWYSFNAKEKLPLVLLNSEFGYDLSSKNTSISSQAKDKFYTYVNPTFGFKLQYPYDWIEKRQNIYDSSSLSDDTLADSLVAMFSPPNYLSSRSAFPPSLSIAVTDWPFNEPPKKYFDFFNKSLNQDKFPIKKVEILDSNSTVIAGNPAFKFIFKYVSKGEESFGAVKESRIEQTTTVLMNKRMYLIHFGSYSSQFYHYLPVVEKIINSFGPYIDQNNTANSTISYNYSTKFSNSSGYKGNTLPNIIHNTEPEKKKLNPIQSTINNTPFSTYADPIYRYSIHYPSFNSGLGKPFSLKSVNPKLHAAEVFALDDPVIRSADLSDAVTLIITPFHKNETQQMKNSPTILDPSGLRTFDINGIVSNVNNHISFLKLIFINFTLLNKGALSFNNEPAYAIEYKYFNPVFKSPMHEKTIYVIVGDYLFILEYQAKPSNYYRYLPVFQNMINSFVFERNIRSTTIPTAG